MKKVVLLFLVLSNSLLFVQAQNQITKSFSWDKFLAQQDLVWDILPPSFNSGAFTGNGQLGMVIHGQLDSNKFVFHLGRVDVLDHRKAPNKKSSAWEAVATPLYDFPRLDIGCMTLTPAGKIISGTMRQHLWDAEITGTIVTTLGSLTFRAITHSTEMVDWIEVTSTEKTSDGSIAPYHWEFVPGSPQSPRRYAKPLEKPDYQKNPEPVLTNINNVPVCVQSLIAGGDYATAWLEKKNSPNQSCLFISTANNIPASNVSAKVAVQSVQTAASETNSSFIESHQEWWHSFYPKSFLSIPDARLESFYWIQQYKYASAVRPDGDLLDDDGPFFRINQWPYATWNLNVQLCYWLQFASNHVEFSNSLTNHIDQNFPLIIKGAKGGALGNIAWAMHNYWWQTAYNADKKKLKDSWYPKASQVLELYLQLLSKGSDGKYHLPAMQSPEYDNKNKALGYGGYIDATYNLSLCKWLLMKLIETSDLLNIKNSQVDKWKETLTNFTAFPVNENGLMIGSNQPFEMSHRHFSHLIGLYPLFVLNPDDTAARSLVLKSVEHWHHIDNGKALAGYSFTGAAELYGALGKGEEAVSMLHQFVNGKIGGSKFLTNTMYVEGKNPVIETPLSGGSAIQDLLLQSWGNKLRVFPAVPDTWKEAVFNDLRGIGAFLVSAKRENGKTTWVSVESLAGEPCTLKVNDWKGELESSIKIPIQSIGNGEYTISLKKGEKVFLYPKGKKVIPMIKPISQKAELINSFGVKKGMVIPTNDVWNEKL